MLVAGYELRIEETRSQIDKDRITIERINSPQSRQERKEMNTVNREKESKTIERFKN